MKEDSLLRIGDKKFSSRLMVGTGKYISSKVMLESLGKKLNFRIILISIKKT